MPETNTKKSMVWEGTLYPLFIVYDFEAILVLHNEHSTDYLTYLSRHTNKRYNLWYIGQRICLFSRGKPGKFDFFSILIFTKINTATNTFDSAPIALLWIAGGNEIC